LQTIGIRNAVFGMGNDLDIQIQARLRQFTAGYMSRAEFLVASWKKYGERGPNRQGDWQRVGDPSTQAVRELTLAIHRIHPETE
jgi:hypothetical protein